MDCLPFWKIEKKIYITTDFQSMRTLNIGIRLGTHNWNQKSSNHGLSSLKRILKIWFQVLPCTCNSNSNTNIILNHKAIIIFVFFFSKIQTIHHFHGNPPPLSFAWKLDYVMLILVVLAMACSFGCCCLKKYIYTILYSTPSNTSPNVRISPKKHCLLWNVLPSDVQTGNYHNIVFNAYKEAAPVVGW